MEKKIIICPQCGSDKIGVIFHGIPGPAGEKEVRETGMGYMYSPDNPVWYCSNCGHKWK